MDGTSTLRDKIQKYAAMASDDIKAEAKQMGREGIKRLLMTKKYGKKPLTAAMKKILAHIHAHHKKITVCEKEQTAQTATDNIELKKNPAFAEFLRRTIIGSLDKKKKVSLSSLKKQLLNLKANLGNPENKKDVIDVINKIDSEEVLKSLFRQCDGDNKVSQPFIYGTSSTPKPEHITTLRNRLIDIVTYIFEPNTIFVTQEEQKERAIRCEEALEKKIENTKLLQRAEKLINAPPFNTWIQTKNVSDVQQTLKKKNVPEPLLSMIIFLIIENIEDVSVREQLQIEWRRSRTYAEAEEIIVELRKDRENKEPDKNRENTETSDSKNISTEDSDPEVFDCDMVSPFDLSSGY